MSDKMSIVQVIQLMLAPGLMISACGLLLLGMNNKYSLVVNRIRLLNEEKRNFFSKAGETNLQYEEDVRLESISIQLKGLEFRVKLVKNAVLSYTIAVAFFVLTSLFIGLDYVTGTVSSSFFVTATFLFGMVLVLLGVIFAAYETKKGFDIIHLEIRADE